MKNVIILGKGSREHVLKEKLSHHETLMIDSEEELQNRINIDLLVVGPEKYLVDGISERYSFPVFGPSKEAARIEGSKIFSKNFMKNYNIPTPEFLIMESKQSILNFFSTNANINNGFNMPCMYVIKRDGLYSGKGVYLPTNTEDVRKIVEDISGETIIEKRIYGEEVSVMGFCNGKDISLFPQICDYKKINEKDSDLNTGGMGAIGPVSILTEAEIEEVKQHMLKVVTHLNFVGVLYAGLMKAKEGIFFLEFNCRLGDPETQVALNLLETDLYQIMSDCVQGNSIDYIKWKKEYASCVVLSHLDYPLKKLKEPVDINYTCLDDTVKIYLSNPIIENNKFKTYGGRVISVVSVSNSLEESLENVYNNASKINYEGKYYRRDIGLKYLTTNSGKKRKLKLGIISSSKGTSIVKLLENMKKLNVSLEIILSDKQTEILTKGMEWNIPYIYLPKIKGDKTYYTKMSNILESFDLDYIFCVGYSRIFSNDFCKKFEGKLLNIHPSLLPDYAGYFNEEIHKKVIQNKETYSGCTLHYVTSKVDQGRIALQKQYRLKKYETISNLKKEIQDLEADTIIDFIKIHQKKPISYKNSGVNIKEGDNFIETIKDDFIGSFCGIYPIGDNYFGASTDGVGTKLELANQYNFLANIGFDLVGMCVNDLIVRGIKPEFFLDYIAMDKIDNDKLLIIVNSIKKACSVAKCKLIGGETAEMPGVYRSNCLDLAGFSVGTLTGELYPKTEKIVSGLKIYGIASNGIHSNGFSLVRKLLKYENYDINTLLKPTKIYMECFQIMEKYKDSLLGLAHITGGGLIDNIKRIIPEDSDLEIDVEIQEEFKWIMEGTGLSYNEMIRTFNCGYGIALIFDDTYEGEEYDVIGKVI